MRKKKVPMKLEDIKDIHSTIERVIETLRKEQIALQDKINDLETKRENIGEVIEALDTAYHVLTSKD